MWDHAATEDMLRSSGLAWTALRNGFYGSSGVQFLGDAPQTGVLEVPEDGPVAWTAHADLATAAAAVLADEGRFDGPTPPLTASEVHDLAGLAALASEAVGRPVERRIIADEAIRDRLPTRAADIVLGFYRAARDGEWARVDPTLGRLIGRAPTAMRALVADSLGR